MGFVSFFFLGSASVWRRDVLAECCNVEGITFFLFFHPLKLHNHQCQSRGKKTAKPKTDVQILILFFFSIYSNLFSNLFTPGKIRSQKNLFEFGVVHPPQICRVNVRTTCVSWDVQEQRDVSQRWLLTAVRTRQQRRASENMTSSHWLKRRASRVT